jgi:hypothetical protein
MKLDPKYMENGIVEVVNHWPVLTDFGQSYGMALMKNMTLIEMGAPVDLAVYESVEYEPILKYILIESKNSLAFTLKGIAWICSYFSTSPTGSENHLSHYDFKHLTEKYFEIGMKLRNDETLISSISITDIVFDVYLGK